MIFLTALSTLAINFARPRELTQPTPVAQVVMKPGVEYAPVPTQTSIRESLASSTWEFTSLDRNGKHPSLRGAIQAHIAEERYGMPGFNPQDGKQADEFTENFDKDKYGQRILDVAQVVVDSMNPPSIYHNKDEGSIELGQKITVPSIKDVGRIVEQS